LVEREESRRVIALLDRIDAPLFRAAECWFGGGSAVSLQCEEFRVSRDVDFLCASRDGYRLLRERVHRDGAQGLFRSPVTLVREARVDRYGIRMAIDIDGQPLKFEIVSEGRIDLVGADDAALPVARLTDEDLVAEKLLANEDRLWDDSALGRDVMDLLLLEHALGGLPSAAWEKARNAYGPSVESAWPRALERMRARPEQRRRAYEAMGVTASAREVIEARLGALPPVEEP
jgi:hypothetical protein